MATLTAIFKAQDNLSKAMQNAANAGTKTNGVMQKLGKIGSTAMKGIVTAVTAAGTALLAFGKKAINVGMEYESSMSQVMATMGIDKSTEAGAKAYAVLDKAASEMGATTAFSASEAADALNYLALAGYDADKAAAALPSVLYLAGAGAMDLASASDMLTDAMSALQIEATQENLTEFSDKLAKTASSSNTSVAQLGEAVLAVGGTAANLKGGVTELTASLGILADAGIKGAEGGTHLRNMINSLQSGKSKEAVNLFKKMGFSAYDAEGNMRSLGDQFKDINAYIEGMSGADVDSVLRTIFNKTDLAAARAMLAATSNSVESLTNIVDSSLAESGKTLSDFGIDLSELAKTFDPLATQEQFAAQMMQDFGLDAETAGMIFDGLNSILSGTGTRFDELTEAIDDSAGACEQMYRTMLDNLNGDVKIFQSTVDALYKDIYTSVGDTLRELVQTGTGYMQRLQKAFSEGGFEGLANEIGNVLGDAITVIMGYIPGLIDAGIDIVSAFVDSIANNADKISQAAVDVAIQLGSAVVKLAPKIVSALGSIFSSAGKALASSIPKIFKAIPDKFYNAIGLDKKKFGKSLDRFTRGMKKTLRNLWKGDFLGAIDGIGTMFAINPQTIAKVKNTLSNVGTWAKTTFSNMKSAFASGFAEGGLFGGIKSAFESLKTSLAGVDWAGIWDGIKNTASEAYDKIKEVVTDAKDKVVEWFNGIDWAGIWNGITNTAITLWNKIKSVAKAAVALVKGWFSSVEWDDIWTSVSTTAIALWEKLKLAAGAGVALVKGWFSSIDWKDIWTSVSSTAMSLWEKLKLAAAAGVALIKGWFGSIDWDAIWTSVSQTAMGLWEKLKSAASAGVALVKGWFTSIDWSGIWTSVSQTAIGLWEKLKSAASAGVALVKGWFSSIDWTSIWTSISQTALGLWEKLKSAASAAVALVKGWFSTVDWGDVWENVGQTAISLWNKLKLAAKAAVALVKGWFSTVDWSGIWENIKSTKDALKTKITEILQSLPEIISGLAEKASSFLSGGTFDGLGDSVISLIKSAITSKAGGGAATIIEAITGLFDGLDLSKIGTKIGEATKGLGNILIDVIDAAFKGATDGSTRLIGAIQGLFEKLLSPSAMQSAAATLSSIGSTIIDVIAAAIRGAQGLATSIYQALADLIASISWEDVGLQLGSFASGLVDKIALSISELANSGSIGTMASSFGTLIGNALSAISSAAIGFGKALVNWILSGDVFVTLNNIANALVEALWGFITSAISAIWDNSWIKGKLDELGDYINGALSKDVDVGFDWQARLENINIEPVFNESGGSLQDTIDGYLNGLANGLATQEIKLEDLPVYLEGKYSVLASMQEAGFSAEDFDFAAINQLITDMFKSAYGQPVEAEVPVAPDVTIDSAAAANMASQYQENVLSATEGIDTSAAGTDAGTNFVNAFGATDPTEQVAVLGESLTTAAATITMDSEGAQVMTTFDTGMNSVKSTIEGTARSTGTSIKTILGNVDLYSTGTNVMRGLLRGMLSMFPTLMERARDIARSIKTTIQDALEVASPSKFTTWVGEMIGQGLINGIESMTAKAENAASNMLSGVSDAFTPATVSPTPATATPYNSLGGDSTDVSSSTTDRHIIIDVKGGGRIEVNGLSKKDAIKLISEQLKPRLQAILAEEIFTGGDSVYEF